MRGVVQDGLSGTMRRQDGGTRAYRGTFTVCPDKTLLERRLELTETWFAGVNRDHYSIQLLATDSSQRRTLEQQFRRRWKQRSLESRQRGWRLLRTL